MNVKNSTIEINGRKLKYYPLSQLADKYDIDNMPYSFKILLENVLRNYDGVDIDERSIDNIAKMKAGSEMAFKPSRVVFQDYTGVPILVDLAAMREYYLKMKRNPEDVNPATKSDLVIDHSIIVDSFRGDEPIIINMKDEFSRNVERYDFLKWSQQSFKNVRIVPPGHGIVHQINLEYLSSVAVVDNGEIFPESLIGADSHTTMIGGIGVLGWGVGGLEAEASMLNEPYFMTVPEVIGVNLKGKIPTGVTPTDVVLYITKTLRARNVVGKFVEFYGNLSELTAQDRATISNMAPEYGATIGYFPVDSETLKYLKGTARDPESVEKYFKEQGLFYNGPKKYSETVDIDLSEIKSAVAGPKNPDELVNIEDLKGRIDELINGGSNGKLVKNGSVVMAAITSCTNTSDPFVLLGAGLMAKKAVEHNIVPAQTIKTSLAPGSKVVTEYLEKAGLMKYLNKIGFELVGYGCTTCIGNAGPLIPEVQDDILKYGVRTFAVLSGNRNFEGRINPYIAGAFLASPMLVVAFALAGTLDIDLSRDPIGMDKNRPVYLKDIWPSTEEIKEYFHLAMDPDTYRKEYSDVFRGDSNWESMKSTGGTIFDFKDDSSYIKMPPWMYMDPVKDVKNGRILAIFGDKITTDHISPAGPIAKDSVAGKYLTSLGVTELNTFGARRGNHEVMLRGGFSNPKIRNLMVDHTGGDTVYYPDGTVMSFYDAAMKYKENNVPLVIFAGKQYGSGSSRDWAAKVTSLLGVKAVIAESFERIHRSNLVDMGIIPIQVDSLPPLKGDETVNIEGISDISIGKVLNININGKSIKGKALINTNAELNYVKTGNILKYIALSDKK
ncbi:MAG: aconitate hydratase AcnA [Ferroplasma sp.]|uniref:aconitate hydratase AcnA n=1 Tax=Ferroplasma sp. TaxID=2591003 RepID=UPI0028169E78|nr:aconitate hydratase AcnA [Ferroplasma sp.]WMT50486.1 MAG: aconitate hydratase AcnA [Ferroplasma sp.]